MPVTIVNQWTATGADQDIELITNPVAGDWLIAIVAARVIDGSAPTLNLGDVSRNLWTLLATDTAWANASNNAAQLQIEVWACPAVAYQGWPWLAVYAAASQITASDVGHVLLDVVEVSGMTGQITVDSITVTTPTAATTASVSIPAPAGAQQCLMVAGAVIDNASATLGVTGGTALTAVSATAPDARFAGSWQLSTAGQTVSWTSSVAVNWAAIAVAVRTTGTAPVQPSAGWPGVQLQFGLGYTLATPLPRIRWTDQSSRLLAVTADRGIQAELGAAQQGTIDLQIRNQDGALTPRAVTASATATGAGTSTTILLPSTTSPLSVGDFFRIQTAAGALKELNVFQVTGLSTAGGTTTVTFARADGSGGGARTATATGDVYAAIPISLYLPVRVIATWQGKTYPIASGWLREMPITYTDAAWAEIQAVGGDVMEALSATPPTALRGEILRRSPTHYWPLDDQQGAGYAQNASGITTSVLSENTSKWGNGSASADFGAATQTVTITDSSVVPPSTVTLGGDSGTGWQQQGNVAADINAGRGFALVGLDGAFPPISGGVTIVGFLLVTQPQLNIITAASVDPTVMKVASADPGSGASLGSVLKLSVNHTTFLPGLTVWDKTTHAATFTNISTGPQLLAGGWESWAVTFTQTSWAVYSQGGLNATGTCNLVPGFSQIDVGGEADQFWSGRCFPGIHAHIAVFPRVLTAQELRNIHRTGQTGHFDVEDEGIRIQKKIGAISWKGSRILTRMLPQSVASEPDPSGTSADFFSETAAYSDSQLFGDAVGQLQFRHRNIAYQQTTRAVLGENTAGGEIPYQAGMQPSYNPTFIYNNVTTENITNPFFGTNKVSTFTAADDGSQSANGVRSLSRSSRFADDYNAWHGTWWLLNRYSYPQLRVEQITVEASGDPTRWPFVLGVEVGDLVTVVRRQIGAPVLSIRCRVLRVQPHLVYGDGGSVSGSVTLTLAAAPPVVGIAGDATAGVVGNVSLGA